MTSRPVADPTPVKIVTARRYNPLLRFILRAPEASIAAVGVILVIVFEILSSNFLTNDNISTVSQFFAPWALIACGEIMLLICGEVDLSVGQVFALAPFVMYFVTAAGLPLFAGVIVALLVSAFLGLCIGLITVMFGVASFITSLGALLLINGLTLTLSGGFPINTPDTPLANILGGWPYSEILWAVGSRWSCMACCAIRAGGCTPSRWAATRPVRRRRAFISRRSRSVISCSAVCWAALPVF